MVIITIIIIIITIITIEATEFELKQQIFFLTQETRTKRENQDEI